MSRRPSSARDDPDADDEPEWRFSIDEVGPQADPDPEPDPIEPEEISLEHATFVAIGVLLTLFVMLTAI